jgi:hypothetical protein
MSAIDPTRVPTNLVEDRSPVMTELRQRSKRCFRDARPSGLLKGREPGFQRINAFE